MIEEPRGPDPAVHSSSERPAKQVGVPDPKPDDSSRRSEETTPDEERLDSLSMDSIFDVLSNPRRRSTIRYLNRADEQPVELRDLAEQIAAWENGVSAHEVTYKERKRVYTSLYQSHLDKMDRLGLVRYDQNRGTVQPTPATEELETYLDAVTDDERSPRYLPLAVAAGSLTFVAGAWTNFVPLDAGHGFVVAFVVAAVFLAVSCALAVLDR